MEYFEKLLHLLKMEEAEDFKAYQQQTAHHSAAQRRQEGLCWYPVAIRGSEMGRGDYLSVELERTTHQDLSHQFRFGASAALFSNHHPGQDRLEGLVSFQVGNRMKITLKTDELPDWASDGKLGVDLLFDNNSYAEMKNALKTAGALTEKSVSWPLVQTLCGLRAPVFDLPKTPVKTSGLNAVQQSAVEKILGARELAIVHGPPGTGKTTTLVQAIKALYAQEAKPILVVAPSNTAVDLLSEKLAEQEMNVVRIGNPVRVSQHLLSLTLDGRIAEHKNMKEVRNLKKQANEFRNMAHKYKRNFGKAEKEQRKALFDEAHKILKEAERTEQYVTQQVLSGAQVITATLVGANHYTVKGLEFHTVVIDEAGQALEPACWIPILKARKLVLAGDHCQLPPTLKSDSAAKEGLNLTLLEKCAGLYPQAVVLLEEQYRMNQAIMGYSSAVFYQNRLKANQAVAGHLLFKDDAPLLFIDTAGCSFEEQAAGTSLVNPEEAFFLLGNLSSFSKVFPLHFPAEEFPSVAIISPYKEQVAFLKEKLKEHSDLMAFSQQISINTIDSFQGQEKDLVYISLTRSNPQGSIGFLSDIRRMNVAMTRAKKKLVVIGDSATLSRSEFYAGFMDYAEKQGAYFSAWEFMDNL
ncbi:AAA domain-containing protein [Pedobacter nutrimenti]|uniref:Putative DNA helicase n=1 Tax=Pedobacter nutrimenti TaxID=1241337 RepID=A0A318UP04_9SPHI|nr:AAA domain-containing protein [Pedobacter nutrimenti]PYF77270.1 putative DNA helicase [Pedobacter nutrimenti]